MSEARACREPVWPRITMGCSGCGLAAGILQACDARPGNKGIGTPVASVLTKATCSLELDRTNTGLEDDA